MPSRDRPRLRVEVVRRPNEARGLGVWLAGIAPATARGHVTVAVVSDRVMRTLNRQYRGADRVTDVLSFSTNDIAIARGVATRQARAHGHSVSTELRVLALHGLLHLLGYDHQNGRDGGVMARVEARLRRRGGLPAGLIARSHGDVTPPAERRRR